MERPGRLKKIVLLELVRVIIIYMQNKTFCSYPWNQLFIDTLGNFYPCCISTSLTLLSKDEDGSTIKAGQKDSVRKHWHSAYMKNIRAGMLAGERPEACNSCWRMEDLGDKSYRAIANKFYKLETTPTELLPEPDFHFLDLRFGNMCNLACRMCVPYSSRKLIPEYREMYGEESVAPYLNLNWFESENIWEELFLYSKNLKKIHLAGGEPLLIKQCWKFLRRLVESGRSKDLVLSYNTNLTNIPPEAKEIWPQFKEVHIIVSMDGVGRVNEFIRYPLKWDQFEANLHDLDDNFHAYHLTQLHIHSTVQVYNVKRISELCDYVATNFKNLKKIPRFDIVYGPEEFNPQVLPAFYREEAAAAIEDYIQLILTGHNKLQVADLMELIRNLRSISVHLRTGDKSDMFHSFKRINDVFDQYRKHRTFDFIPELERAF